MMMKRMGGFCLLTALALPGAVAAQQTPGKESFVIRRGNDTVAVERFTRTPARLEGELALQGTPMQRFTAELAPNALVPRFEYSVQATGASAPLVSATVVFRGDSALATVSAPGAPPEQRFAPGAGALPYVNLSGALLEQMVRRATVLGGDSVTVPFFAVANGQSFRATVRRYGTDSATITLPPGVELRLRTDVSGRMLGGCVPAQGITIERSGVPAPSCSAPVADYSAPAGAPYTAQAVTLRAPDGVTLAGTLTLPRASKPVPAVLLLSGSGAQDRDEAIPGIEGYRPFRQIADTLSRRGIAVLRLDDRGIGGSGGSVNATVLPGFAADAEAAIAYLRTRPEIDGKRIGIVGHSEGGIVGPMVAAKDRSVKALALLAAPAQSGRALVTYQQRYMIGSDSTIPASARDSLLALSAVQTDSLAARSPWFGSLIAYDPIPVARTIKQPVLILQGATDRQVPAAQAEELAAAIRSGGNRNVTVRIFPGTNHLFLPDPSGDPRGYTALPVHSVPPEVLGTLADWLVPRLR